MARGALDERIALGVSLQPIARIDRSPILSGETVNFCALFFHIGGAKMASAQADPQFDCY